jgi:hypothetical protein
MTVKFVHSYYYYKPAPWPSEISKSYAEKIGTSGNINVEIGSVDEENLLYSLNKNNIPFIKEPLVIVSERDIKKFPFYRLIVKDHDYRLDFYNYRDMINHYSNFLTMDRACHLDLGEDGNRKHEDMYCYIGAEQKDDFIIDEGKFNRRYDIVSLLHPLEWILLISKRMKQFLESEGFTGCSIRRCRTIDSVGKKARFSKLFYQLVIDKKVARPPKAKAVATLCRRCHSVGLLSWYFNDIDDLGDVDFQYIDEAAFQAENREKIVRLQSPLIIMSSNALSKIISRGLKGLNNFRLEPKIKYSVVNIKNVSLSEKMVEDLPVNPRRITM